MKNRTQKLVLGIVKILGIIVCILIAITLIVVSALLYYENHDFSDQNGLDKKSSPAAGETWKYGVRCLCRPVRRMFPLLSYATNS